MVVLKLNKIDQVKSCIVWLQTHKNTTCEKSEIMNVVWGSQLTWKLWLKLMLSWIVRLSWKLLIVCEHAESYWNRRNFTVEAGWEQLAHNQIQPP